MIVRLLPKKLTKKLKVVNKPQGKSYAPGINLQGEYLKNYGFGVGDFVKIEISANRIVIKKESINENLRRA